MKSKLLLCFTHLPVLFLIIKNYLKQFEKLKEIHQVLFFVTSLKIRWVDLLFIPLIFESELSKVNW